MLEMRTSSIVLVEYPAPSPIQAPIVNGIAALLDIVPAVELVPSLTPST
jgi:hypothetical protein